MNTLFITPGNSRSFMLAISLITAFCLGFSATARAALKSEQAIGSKRSSTQNARSMTSLIFSGSPDAFGQKDITPFMNDVQARSFILDILYTPSFLNSFGSLSFGPSFGIYPTSGNVKEADGVSAEDVGQPITGSALDIYHVGLSLQYQFRYLERQWIVPHVGVNGYLLKYSFLNDQTGSTLMTGVSAGIHIPLGHIERNAQRNLDEDFSIKNTAIIIEAKNLGGSDENVSISGTSYFFGLRLDL
jgi:hypothetical protein